MTYDLVDDLRREISQGHVLVVVGSGVSIGATGGDPLASWKGLLENGADRCVKVRGLKPDWAERVKAEIQSGDMDDLLSAAEKISSKLGFPSDIEYRRWLRETVGTLRAKDRAVLEALRDLNLPLATTNYDSLLEEVTGFPAVTWRDGDKAIRVIRREEKGILHLHGYWDEPESVVLGIRTYERILDNKHAQAVLRALQTLKTLLFVGCGEGLADPNFGALLAWARKAFKESGGRHYRLCREEEIDKLRELHKEDHLHPLSYGAKHSGLADYLGKLGTFSSLDQEGKDDTGAHSSHPRAQRLPGKPRCFGRKDEVRELVETLLQPSPPPTPILGGPGVGKTTITLEALHDRRIVERYRARRFFVRCDGAKSREALVGKILRTLGIEPGPRPEDSLFAELEREPAVLALDNGETPWEADTTAVEDLLSLLGSVNGLGLVVSIRGDQRPLGPSWREAIRVGPLGLPASQDAFIAVAGERFRRDPDLDRLLEAVDRLPLAIVLLAHEAEGEPNLAGLWKRWQEKRTALLKRGDSQERLTNIEVSLDLSLSGSRMTPDARRLLSVLGHLPDGVAHGDFDSLLPGQGDDSASVLRKVGLAFDQGTRLRVLAPVREYVRRQYPPEGDDLSRIVDHYLNLAREGDRVGREGGGEVAAKLVNELGNVEAILYLSLERVDPKPAIHAAFSLGRFNVETGWGSSTVLLRATEISLHLDDPRLQAHCIRQLGDVALYRSEHGIARERYKQALPLYKSVGDILGEANCIKSLGDILLRRSDHDTARKHYEEALPLFERIGDILGKADCIKSLGNIAFRRSDHDTARERYEQALLLFRGIGSVLGEANCIQSLGDIAFARSDYDTARERYTEVLPLYRRVGSVLGEANCIKGLGNIALRRSDHDTARERYEQALSLFRHVGSVRGEANCIESLGDIALARSNHGTACECYTEALPLYQRVGSVLGEANCIQSLGDIALAQSDHDTAHEFYEHALPLFQRVGDVLGEANCFQSLGDIALARSNYDTGRERYKQALPLYRRVGSVLGEANCIKSLGDIALNLSDSKTAGVRFTEALGLYKKIQEPYSIGWTHVRLARLASKELGLCQSHIQAAREAWESIKRPDLVNMLREEFGEIADAP